MRRISRFALPQAALVKLSSNTEEIRRLPPGKQRADRAVALWKRLPIGTKRSIQGVLAAMSTGLQRCMYCEDGQGTDIEHFRPKSAYPLHAFVWGNYLLACSHCNSNHKRTAFPLDADGTPLLIDPTVDDPVEHMALSPSTGLFEARDAKGTATIAVCGLNRDVCASGRQDAWVSLSQLAIRYAMLRDRDPASSHAEEILRAVRRYPFQSVRVHMVEILKSPRAARLLVQPETRQAFERYPELAGLSA
ncbi:uncharacterized protein (TIGR02646 family) [Allocatelliglobosispora scoriae]|uniref:Uncharacterized protein (TIGR02646 family) n=1 Tax=Allocatelliglobosispora scoriae TaxID=643052 RepID=A0A841BUT9_9ACTN|nr:HNH endonuclease [Allocatelliglobosispora scoriae]MBB5872877.1 uncharacterized protein (TIGR02646 family) [Allocatelliglobosispora scoriae]